MGVESGSTRLKIQALDNKILKIWHLSDIILLNKRHSNWWDPRSFFILHDVNDDENRWEFIWEFPFDEYCHDFSIFYSLWISRLLKVGFVHAMPVDARLVYVTSYMQSIFVRMQLTSNLTVLCRELISFYLKIMQKVFINWSVVYKIE